eukprot:Hpha_TRINITY_DN36671_c0_g1::TRINITY_DN36671_c0_g1_i1::g.18735::m.18735
MAHAGEAVLQDTAPVLSLVDGQVVTQEHVQYSSPALPRGLENCEKLQQLYSKLGPVPADTVVSQRHGFLDHLLGPHSISNLFSSPARMRPDQSRLLIENYDPLYCVQGMTRVTGTAWLAGMVVGGVGGFYEGLKRRDSSGRSWRSAYLSLWNFSFHQGPRRANTFASIALAFCVFESAARYLIMKNQSMLRFKEKGFILGRFGSADDRNLQIWQADGRLCAPVGAAAAAIFLRSLKGGAAAAPHVVATNAVLAAGIAFGVSHMWDPVDYFDINKTMGDDALF